MFNLFDLIARYLFPKTTGVELSCNAAEGWACIPGDRLGL